jgi:hypothetical protein
MKFFSHLPWRALFEIVDADLKEASERQQAYLAKQKQEPTTVTPLIAGN